MTLSISGSNINITNTNGTVKFNSSDKLLYLKHVQIDTINVYNAVVFTPFYALESGDFLILNLRFNSTNGNIIVSSTVNLLNMYLPANGTLVTNFDVTNDGQGTIYVETQQLGASICGSNLMFVPGYGADFYYRQAFANTVNSNITYDARIYSYL